MSSNESDVQARLGELEATVRGLTLELVEANERIRELEARLGEDGDDEHGAPDGPPASAELDLDADDGEGERSTKQMGADSEDDGEADSELDDIIVA